MRNVMTACVGAALVLSIGALWRSRWLPDASARSPNPATSAQNLRAAGWLEAFAWGQKAAQQTGKPIFMIIT